MMAPPPFAPPAEWQPHQARQNAHGERQGRGVSPEKRDGDGEHEPRHDDRAHKERVEMPIAVQAIVPAMGIARNGLREKCSRSCSSEAIRTPGSGMLGVRIA